MTTEPRARGAGWLRWGLSLLLLGLVAHQLWAHWHALPMGSLKTTWAWFPVAFALMGLHFALSAEGWRRWVMALGTPLSYPAAFRMVFVSNLSKYLPGGVWNYVDRGLLVTQAGAPAATAAASIALDLACQLAAAVLVGGLGLAFAPVAGGPLAAVFAVGAVLAMHPRVLNAAFAWAEARLNRPFPRVDVGYGRVLGLLAFYAVSWAILGLGFAALTWGVSPLHPSLQGAAVLGGSFTLSWAIGTLTPLAPAGLGTREAALLALLSPWFPAAFPAVMAIAARIWLLLGELVMFAIALLACPLPDRRGTDD